MSGADWRADRRVLVTDAHAMGSLAAIRSLGRAGYQVHAASDSPEAIGLRSAFVHQRSQYPAVAADRRAFCAWLRNVVHDQRIDAIVPSEAVLLAIRDDFDTFRALLPVSADSGVVYAGLSKYDLFARMGGIGADRLPGFLLVGEDAPVPDDAALAELSTPMFVKADAAYAVNGTESIVKRCDTATDARQQLSALRGRYRRILVQAFAPGVGVGAFLLRWNGRILARFMHRRLHEVPHTGGASSFRRAWWNQEIFDDAVRRAEAMNWQGVAMLEYRWDPETGDFRLVEMNGRFWGSLHLALFSGVDFPRLLLDAFFGHEELCMDFDRGVRCRFAPREIEYVWSRLKDRTIGWHGKAWSLIEFLLLGLDPRVRSDLSFPRDRWLYCHALREAAARWTRS